MKSTPKLQLPGDFVKAPTALLTASDLSPAEKLLWQLILAHCVGDNETCFPSVNRLAAFACLKPRWTSDLLTSLERKGYLARELRKGKSTVYSPKLPAGPMQYSAGVNADPCSTPHDTHAVECVTTHAVECTLIRGIESEELNQITQPKGAGRTDKKSAKPKPATKAKSDPNPDVRVVIDYFSDKYLEKFGVRYSVAWGKDGKILKDLLRDHSLEILQRCIDFFFADSDPWLDGKRTLGVFRSRINAYIQQTAIPKAAPTPAAYRRL
jgi:hypothetical protein